MSDLLLNIRIVAFLFIKIGLIVDRLIRPIAILIDWPLTSLVQWFFTINVIAITSPLVKALGSDRYSLMETSEVY